MRTVVLDEDDTTILSSDAKARSANLAPTACDDSNEACALSVAYDPSNRSSWLFASTALTLTDASSCTNRGAGTPRASLDLH